MRSDVFVLRCRAVIGALAVLFGGAGLGGERINADKAADVSSRHFLGEEIGFVFIGCD